jgi:hypothetical protein
MRERRKRAKLCEGDSVADLTQAAGQAFVEALIVAAVHGVAGVLWKVRESALRRLNLWDFPPRGTIKSNSDCTLIRLGYPESTV